MAVTLPGLVSGLADAGNAYTQDFYGAIGNARARNLALMKQDSESAYQQAQANYFNSRNPTALGIATTRADGQDAVARIRAQAMQNIADGVAAGKLPAEFAGQPAESVRAHMQYLDSLNPNSHLEAQYFPDSVPGGLAAPPNVQTPGGLPLASGGLPPAASMRGVMTPPSMTFSAPGVGVSGMGQNTLPAPPITGSSPAPPPIPTNGAMNAAMPPPASVPPSASPAPLVNPFNPNPLTAARITHLGKQDAHMDKQDASLGDKDQQQFFSYMGTLAPALRPSAAAAFNKANNTNFPVPSPGMMPTVTSGPMAGQPALGPPTQAYDPYTPNALQIATIGQKNAGANLDKVMAQYIGPKFDLSKYSEQQKIAVQNRAQELVARGQDLTSAYHDALIGLGQGNLAVRQGGLGLATDKYQDSTTGVLPAAQRQSLIQKYDATKNRILAGAVVPVLTADGKPTGRTQTRPLTQTEQSMVDALDTNIGSLQKGGGTGAGYSVGTPNPSLTNPAVNPYMNKTPAQLRAIAKSRGKL